LSLDEPAETARAFYSALSDADLDRLMALCDDDVEFVNPDDAAEPGVRAGAPAVRQAFERLLSDFTDYRCTVLELTPVGEDMAVVEESSGIGRASGIPFREVHGNLLTLRDGRVTRFRWFRTVEELHRAVAGADQD
jgi:ketosteroid isomerase-like protein